MPTDSSSASIPSGGSFGVGASAPIGSFRGAEVSAGASVKIDNLLPIRATGSIDTIQQTVGVSGAIDLPSPAGDFGATAGVKLGVSEWGIPEIRSVMGGGTAFGVQVKLGVSGGFKPSMAISYEFGPISVGLGLAPDGKGLLPVAAPKPPSKALPPGALTPDQIDEAMPFKTCAAPCVTLHYHWIEDRIWLGEYGDYDRSLPPPILRTTQLCYGSIPGQTTPQDTEFGWIESGSLVASTLRKYFNDPGDAIVSHLTIDPTTTDQCFRETPSEAPVRLLFLNLPNYPQEYKSMNCCDKVEEIYRYLGIAKIKKQKFKVAKQFLAPGGSGTEDCEDYYQINQALFRMLANGLIINPISKPLGSEWKSVNATAWAGQIYEMVAEAMSNGDTTQKFEISTIMQEVQLMSAVAELSRKVEFLADALGITPGLDTEELPVCFTIHEKHKGFAKKEPVAIDVAAAKTDTEVEKVLGKMLQPSKIPIVKWVFKPDSISIVAALSKL